MNGYRGIDYSGDDLTVEQVGELTAFLAESGTTRHAPTIVTSSRERILRSLRVIREARERSARLEWALPGIHVEGPFISIENGPRGAHDSRYVRDPSHEEYLEWQDAAGGMVRMVTIAPERNGALDFISRVSREGVVVAIGHTGASPELIRDAVAAGAAISTHLGNGSHELLPRLRNYIWEQLASDDLWAGMIADGYHLPSAVVKVIARAKGLDRLVLVSDVAPLGGSEPGRYRWGDIEVEVFADGHLGLVGTTFLAGAGHLLDRCIARFVHDSGSGIGDAVRLCTDNPARLMGAGERESVGKPPAVGEPANLTLFRHRPGDERLEVLTTIANGEILFNKE